MRLNIYPTRNTIRKGVKVELLVQSLFARLNAAARPPASPSLTLMAIPYVMLSIKTGQTTPCIWLVPLLPAKACCFARKPQLFRSLTSFPTPRAASFPIGKK